MEQVVIGVDPYKLSATIEVVDEHELVLGSGRFTTDRAAYAAMRRYRSRGRTGSGRWREPTGSGAVGSAVARGRRASPRRPGEAGRPGPALRHRAHRKTDALDAYSIAVVAVRTEGLRVLRCCGWMVSWRRCGCSPIAARR